MQTGAEALMTMMGVKSVPHAGLSGAKMKGRGNYPGRILNEDLIPMNDQQREEAKLSGR